MILFDNRTQSNEIVTQLPMQYICQGFDGENEIVGIHFGGLIGGDVVLDSSGFTLLGIWSGLINQ